LAEFGERQQVEGVDRIGGGLDGGHGIGLAVVKTLIERMGGRVQVSDAPGGGADFQLRFPAVLSAPVDQRPQPSASLRRWLNPG